MSDYDYSNVLNPDNPINVALFDKLVDDFFQNGSNAKLNEVLTKFANHEKAWMQSSEIILKSNSPQSKIIALTALQQCIQTQWKVLPPAEKDGIRRFIESVIVKSCEQIQGGQSDLKAFLTKLNTTLIEIVKHEWPHNWSDFLPSIINFAQANEVGCINVVSLLRIFSEEVWGERTNLTQKRAETLRNTLQENGNIVFNFFLQILKNSKNVILLQETLKSLNNYVTFLPAEFIFESDLVEMLTLQYFPTEFQLRAMECLCEIVSLPIIEQTNFLKNSSGNVSAYREKLYSMFSEVVRTFENNIPENTSIAQLLQSSGQRGEAFIRLFITLACTYLKNNIRFIETNINEPQPSIISALRLLLQTTAVKEDEILVILTGFWDWWSQSQVELTRGNKNNTSFFLQGNQSQQKISPYFQHIVGDLAEALVRNMARPREVLVTRDSLNNFVESEVKQSTRLQIYKNMSITLQRLCEIDLTVSLSTIEGILHSHFGDIQNQSHFKDWEILDSVCWSIGSISNSIPDKQSKDFLVKAIQALLYLCERTPEKQDKAIVAANIMYVVRKNPKFLTRYWKLLQTVIGKLFEFMQERFPGVQEMACETFEEIARRCRNAFSSDRQPGAIQFLDHLLTDLPRVVNFLSPKLIQQLWKGFGWIIRAEKDENTSYQLQVQVMTVPNMVWVRSIERFKEDTEGALNDLPLCTNLINILKTNGSLCETLKQRYNLQLAKIMEEMMFVYRVTGVAIIQYGERHGVSGMRHDICIVWRNIIRSTLELLTTCIETRCLEEFQVISGCLDVVLTDFAKVPPLARDPEVFNLCTTIVKKLGNQLEDILPIMLDAIVRPTREMIDNNEEFPDHRRNFFIFLKEVVTECFQSLGRLSAEQFNQILNVIIWAMKHLDQQMADIGLQALLMLIQKMSSSSIANEFYSTYLALILTETFGALTDTMHKGGFSYQVQILRQLINLVDSGNVTIRLWSADVHFNSNRDCVKHSIMTLVHQNFPNLHENTIRKFADDLFSTCQVNEKFEVVISDFLACSKEIQTERNATQI